MNLRPLTQAEQDEVWRVLRRDNELSKATKLQRNAKVVFLQDGNFTVCLLASGSNIYAGAAKRNPNDNSSDVGNQVALARAARSTGVNLK